MWCHWFFGACWCSPHVSAVQSLTSLVVLSKMLSLSPPVSRRSVRSFAKNLNIPRVPRMRSTRGATQALPLSSHLSLHIPETPLIGNDLEKTPKIIWMVMWKAIAASRVYGVRGRLQWNNEGMVGYCPTNLAWFWLLGRKFIFMRWALQVESIILCPVV
jgi:hypothetical protein